MGKPREGERAGENKSMGAHACRRIAHRDREPGLLSAGCELIPFQLFRFQHVTVSGSGKPLNVFFRPASALHLSRRRLNEGGTIQRFNDSTFQRITSAKRFFAIRSMSAIGIICHWSLAPPAATRFRSSTIVAVIVLRRCRQALQCASTQSPCRKSSWR
jgi:hypothetical protein